MDDYLLKLANLGSRGILDPPAEDDTAVVEYYGNLGIDLFEWLCEKNGFYAFENALHVFPIGSEASVMDLRTWNSPALWRDAYADLAEGILFFAEDVFGNQFCIKNDKVGSFDAETGTVQPLANSLNGWAKAVLSWREMHTGCPLAHEWQTNNRPLEAGERLLPKVPFVSGGEYSVDNLYVLDAVKGMRLRGDIARHFVVP
jgi:hypothetical protein